MKGSERAALRAQANTLQPIVHIGKEGITEKLVKQVDDALTARELIKGTVQKNCDIPVRDAAHILAEELEAECIQVIGRRFTLYREKPEEKID